MKTKINFSLALIITIILMVISCTKDQNLETIDQKLQQVTDVSTVIIDNTDNSATQRDHGGGCITGPSCPGSLTGCDCSTYSNCEYKIEILDILAGGNVSIKLIAPWDQTGFCFSYTSDGTYYDDMDTELFAYPAESEWDGIQWKVKIEAITGQTPQLTPVKVKISQNECGCSKNYYFTLDLDTNDSTYDFYELFCLQCQTQSVGNGNQ